jgi:hypothetical protein
MDDPILWGILPVSYMLNPNNHRWGLGSYDLCFTNKYGHRFLRQTAANKNIEDSQPSLLWVKSYRHIARRTRTLADYSSQP